MNPLFVRALVGLGMVALLFSSAAVLVTKAGDRLTGTVVVISEQKVVVQTEGGLKKVDPMQIEELTLDQPWVLAFSDGTVKIGRLHVKNGKWFFEGQPLNFYSVYAFSPKKKAKLVTFKLSGAKEEHERESGTASEKVKTEVREKPKEEGSDRAKLRLGGVPSPLPRGRVRVEGRSAPDEGEVLAITPQYLLMNVQGEIVRLAWRQVRFFETPTLWTAVGPQGKRWTGALRYEQGRWWIGGRAFRPSDLIAFVPRLDLGEAKIRASKPSPVAKKASSPPPKGNKAPMTVDRCPDPASLATRPKVDVSGWELGPALATAGDFANSGDLSEAIRIYRSVLGEKPGQAEALIGLASVYRKVALACEEAGNSKRARFYFKQASEAYAEAEANFEGGAKAKRSAAYWKERAAKEALWGSKAVEAFEKGYQSFLSERYEQAESAFARAIAENPTWPDPYYWRARALLKLGRREQAVRALTDALKADPSFLAAQELLLALGEVPERAPLDLLLKAAYVHETAGRLEEAEKIYEAVVKRFPSSFLGRYRYGLLERRLRRWDKARALLETALNLAGDEENRKKVAYWLKRLDKDEAFGIQAVNAFEKGYAEYASGNYKAAASAFALAAERAPKWLDAKYWYARALLKLEERDRAKEVLHELLEEDPKHTEALKLLRSIP